MKNKLLLLWLFLMTVAASAQWKQTAGPYGGTINTLFVNGSNLFAGTYNGAFLSTNNGNTWTPVNAGMTNTKVYSFAVIGSNLFAGTDGTGVFLSTNNGSNWTAVNSGLTSTNVRTLAVNGSNLFVGTYGKGVFLSTDNGNSWTAVNTGLTNPNIYSLAVNGSNLFAGTDGGGVFLSTDNGNSWTAVNTGLTSGYVRALAVSGSNLFVGVNEGVFLSTNNGTSWSKISSGLTTTNVLSLAMNGSNLFAGTYGGGVFLSTDNGNSWNAVNNGLSASYIYSLAVNGSNLLAGTSNGGVFLSTNNGTSWNEASVGLTNTFVRSLTVNSSNVYAGTEGGIYLSANNGTSWTAVNSGLTNRDVRSIVVKGTNLFAGTYQGGVFLSTDNGNSWNAVNTGLTNTDVRSLAVSGSNLFAGTSGGIFLSTDNGTSWNAVNSGLTATFIPSLAVSGSNIFAGTFVSGTYYGGTVGSGAFLSSDNGNNWTPVNNGLTALDIRALAVIGSNLFAGTFNGVFLSTDNGSNWTPVNTGLINTGILSLAVSGNNLFAGTGGGVFLSTDNGSSWNAVNAGLINTGVLTLASTNSNLFAGTFNKGVWVRPLSEMINQLINLPNGTVGVGYNYDLNANTSPKTYTLSIGSLPNGLYLEGTYGVIYGVPTVSGTFNFTLIGTDAQGQQTTQAYSLVVNCPNLTITSTLPDSNTGSSYMETLTTTGGSGSYLYSVSIGSLPDGLYLDGFSGTIYGSPSKAGTFPFTISSIDTRSCQTSKSFTLIISCPNFVINTDLPDGTVNTGYLQNLSASGGTGNVIYSVSSGSLPTGLYLDGFYGAIYGGPSQAGTFAFTLTATNSQDCQTSKSYNLTIAPSGGRLANTSVKSVSQIGEEESIQLFPNPANDRFNISLNTDETVNIHIYDIFGRKVYEQKHQPDTHLSVVCEVKELSSGTYFVKFTAQNQTKVLKLIKN